MLSLRLTPPKAPSLLVSLSVSAAALAVGVLLRIAILGLDRGFGMSSTYLPAVIVATVEEPAKATSATAPERRFPASPSPAT